MLVLDLAELPVLFTLISRDIMRMDNKCGPDRQGRFQPRRLVDLAAYTFIGQENSLEKLHEVSHQTCRALTGASLFSVKNSNYIVYLLRFHLKISDFSTLTIPWTCHNFPKGGKGVSGKEFATKATHGGLPKAKLVLLFWSNMYGGEHITYFTCLSQFIPSFRVVQEVITYATNFCPETNFFRQGERVSFLHLRQTVQWGQVDEKKTRKSTVDGEVQHWVFAPRYRVQNQRVSFDFERPERFPLVGGRDLQLLRNTEKYLRIEAGNVFSKKSHLTTVNKS